MAVINLVGSDTEIRSWSVRGVMLIAAKTRFWSLVVIPISGNNVNKNQQGDVRYLARFLSQLANSLVFSVSTTGFQIDLKFVSTRM
jgi:hypothetical protein